jgi:hypothetical protein
MSFDLAVWYSHRPLRNEEAGEIYVQLCEQWPSLEGENLSVAAFYDELTKRWPEIDTVPDDKVDDTDYCPWSCALNHSGMAVVMPCVWSKADDVAEFVHKLAQKHGLVLYDPQTGIVYLPEQLKR